MTAKESLLGSLLNGLSLRIEINLVGTWRSEHSVQVYMCYDLPCG